MSEEIGPVKHLLMEKYKAGEYKGTTEKPSLYLSDRTSHTPYSKALIQYFSPIYKPSLYKSNFPRYSQSQTPMPKYHSKPSYTNLPQVSQQPSFTLSGFTFEFAERTERRIRIRKL